MRVPEWNMLKFERLQKLELQFIQAAFEDMRKTFIFTIPSPSQWCTKHMDHMYLSYMHIPSPNPNPNPINSLKGPLERMKLVARINL